jgi:4-hydroxybenzoate polyprenyltransferase
LSGYYTNELEVERGTFSRWWVYQKERFPVFAHAPLVAAFSFSAVCYSSLLRGQTTLPRLAAAAVAFLTSLIFFLQLRIADEHKDFEEDLRFRPYRPVQRGLVTLRELGAIGFAGALGQLSLALILRPALIIPLAATWLYLALMSKEFFARRWLKARPLTYMLTHMLIIPMVDFYATSCDWLARGERQPSGLFWFLAASFFNGVVLETGRKIRAPEDEETGVETYTALWGRHRAAAAWMCALTLTALSALMAAKEVNFILPVSIILSALLIGAATISLRFLRKPLPSRARMFESFSGAWTLVMYLSLGAAPLILKSYGISL